ncbi:MAG: DUF4292 domain-containing protein [Bacteroidota bacterium]|nr:DUF4292 domain-containing protein [Bacteroidota bacterium]
MKITNLLLRLLCLNLLIIAMFSACRPVRKVQSIGHAITKKDTALKEVTQSAAIDSATIIQNIVNRLDKQRIHFKTFSAKVKMDYDGNEGSGNATVYLRMQKDSLIWLSLTGALGIEGFRVMITPDSVKIMNKLQKIIQYRPISFLQELTEVPVDFANLQDILIGNPVYLDSNIVSYSESSDNLLILMAGKVFKNLLTLDKTNLRLLHSKLDDVNPLKNRTADITFDDYNKVDDFYFSTSRKISVAERAKLDVNLQFKQYDFDKSLTFPFNIPKNYRVR